MWFFVLVGLVLIKCSDGAVGGLIGFVCHAATGLWWVIKQLVSLIGWLVTLFTPLAACKHVATDPRDPGIQPEPIVYAGPAQQLTSWSPAELRERLAEIQPEEDKPMGRIIDNARVVC